MFIAFTRHRNSRADFSPESAGNGAADNQALRVSAFVNFFPRRSVLCRQRSTASFELLVDLKLDVSLSLHHLQQTA
jgi:hypothetical protein